MEIEICMISKFAKLKERSNKKILSSPQGCRNPIAERCRKGKNWLMATKEDGDGQSKRPKSHSEDRIQNFEEIVLIVKYSHPCCWKIIGVLYYTFTYFSEEETLTNTLYCCFLSDWFMILQDM